MRNRAAENARRKEERRLASHDGERVQGRRQTVAAWATRFDAFSTDEVMEAHGMTRDNAAQTLSRLVRDGWLVRLGGGEYRSMW